MFNEEKNIKDNTPDSLKDTASAPVPYDSSLDSSVAQIGSYSKANKLITALYMVTDILDHDEPIKGKLRILATDLLSDIYSASAAYRTTGISKSSIFSQIENKTIQILSFLDIASSVHLISEMNANILKNEFFALKKAIKEHEEKNTKWLEGLFSEDSAEGQSQSQSSTQSQIQTSGQTPPQRGGQPTQKDIALRTSKGHSVHPYVRKNEKDIFDDLKRQRRQEITAIIKGTPAGATITDIRARAKGALLSCGEKTLQRELVSLVGDGVLKKEGEKRWSRYFLA